MFYAWWQHRKLVSILSCRYLISWADIGKLLNDSVICALKTSNSVFGLTDTARRK